MTGNKAQGFSLIEMLIAVSLFALAGTVLSIMVVSMGRLHRRVAYTSVLNAEMRSISEMISRQTRMTHLRFPVGGFAMKTSSFQLASKDPTVSGYEQIRLGSGAECSDTTITSCLVVDIVDGNGGTVTHVLTGSRVNVKTFDVYPRPLTSPFDAVQNPPAVQPMVTIRIGLQYMVPDSKENASMEGQMTFSFRDYQR